MVKSAASRANKTNGKSSTRSLRQLEPRASAPTSFVNEDDWSDEIQNSEDENESGGTSSVDMIQEFQKIKAKTATTSSNTFQNQKIALYAQARQNAYNAARDGNDYLEQALDKMSQLKSQEGSYKKHLKDFLPLYNTNDEAIQSLLATYPTLLQDLVPRRTEEIDAASSMLMSLPVDREASRKRLMRNARAQIDEGLENQRVATDTSALIKHYKALLLS